MDFIFLILGAVFVVGAGLALYEWRYGETVRQDIATKPAQTEADRDLMRMQDAQARPPMDR